MGGAEVGSWVSAYLDKNMDLLLRLTSAGGSSIKEEETTASETDSAESLRKRSSSGSGDIEASAFRQVRPSSGLAASGPKLKMSPTSVSSDKEKRVWRPY